MPRALLSKRVLIGSFLEGVYPAIAGFSYAHDLDPLVRVAPTNSKFCSRHRSIIELNF